MTLLERQRIADVRCQVFERERGICRCCGVLAAETMREIRPPSLGGTVCTQNSIAVCGDRVRGCYGKLQRHEITVEMEHKGRGANGILVFFDGPVVRETRG